MKNFGEIITPPSFGEDSDPKDCLCYVFSDLRLKLEMRGPKLFTHILGVIGLKCSPSALEDVEEFDSWDRAGRPQGFGTGTSKLNLHIRRYRECGKCGKEVAASSWGPPISEDARCKVKPGHQGGIPTEGVNPGSTDGLEKIVCIVCFEDPTKRPLSQCSKPTNDMEMAVNMIWEKANNIEYYANDIRGWMDSLAREVRGRSNCPMDYGMRPPLGDSRVPCERIDQHGLAGGAYARGGFIKGWSADKWCRMIPDPPPPK